MNIGLQVAAAKALLPWLWNDRNGPLIASFPAEESDQIMLVTDGGQLIRCPIDGIRIAGRSTQGVTVFKTPWRASVLFRLRKSPRKIMTSKPKRMLKAKAMVIRHQLLVRLIPLIHLGTKADFDPG